MLHTAILAIHIVTTLLLIGLILIQRSDSDGFGMGGGGNALMTGRSTANLLTRTTAILATIFICTSLGLSMTGQRSKDSIVDQLSAPVSVPAAPVNAPSVPLPGAEAPGAKPAKSSVSKSEAGKPPAAKPSVKTAPAVPKPE